MKKILQDIGARFDHLQKLGYKPVIAQPKPVAQKKLSPVSTPKTPAEPLPQKDSPADNSSSEQVATSPSSGKGELKFKYG